MQTFDRLFGSGPRIHLTILSLAVICYFLRITYSWTSFGLSTDVNLSGASVALIGWAILAGWSLVSLGRKIGLTVLQSGPYKYMRHPIYSAEIFFWWIAILFLLDSWLPIVGMVITFWLANHLVKYEEELMAIQFGDQWKAYAAVTPRFFPRLGKKQ